MEATKPLSPADRARYQRQLVIPEVGEAGQLKLRAAKVLVVSTKFDDKTLLAHRNIPGVMCLPAHEVSIEELLYHDAIILTADALEVLAARTN